MTKAVAPHPDYKPLPATKTVHGRANVFCPGCRHVVTFQEWNVFSTIEPLANHPAGVSLNHEVFKVRCECSHEIEVGRKW